MKECVLCGYTGQDNRFKGKYCILCADKSTQINLMLNIVLDRLEKRLDSIESKLRFLEDKIDDLDDKVG